MDAFTAGKIDADLMSNGDTLVTGAGSGGGVMIMVTDYSSGSDMIVGKPGIKGLKDLKGKKVGIEVGLVEHLLLLHALQTAGMTEKDVSLVNAKTNETPQVPALQTGRGHGRVATDLRPGHEGRSRLAPALYLGKSAGIDL